MENRIAEKWKIGWAETWKIGWAEKWKMGWAEEQTREVRKVTVGVIGPLSKNMQAYTYRAGRKIKIDLTEEILLGTCQEERKGRNLT